MTRDEILALVSEILVDVLMLEDDATVTQEAHIVSDLGAESINVAEIAVAVENEFGIAVPDDMLAEVTTVGALVDRIEAALSSR